MPKWTPRSEPAREAGFPAVPCSTEGILTAAVGMIRWSSAPQRAPCLLLALVGFLVARRSQA